MIALWMVGVALADPLALRAGNVDGVAAGVLGLPLSSVGVWTEDWGLAVGSRELSGLTVEGAHRWRRDAGQTELQLHGGLGALWLEPGMSAQLGATLLRREERERLGWTGSLSLPWSVRLVGARPFDGPELRLPVMLGSQVRFRIGEVWVGPLAELGVVSSPERPWAMGGQLGLVVGG